VIGSTCANWLEKQVIDPAGGILRCENYHQPTFTVKVNTNCKVLHLDDNREKFPVVQRKYGRRVTIRNAGRVGDVCVANRGRLGTPWLCPCFRCSRRSARVASVTTGFI